MPSNLDPMPADVVLLVATAVLAVVATVAACVAVVAVRRVGRHREALHEAADPAVTAEVTRSSVPDVVRRAPEASVPTTPVVAASSAALEPYVVEGRVVVPPSHEQVARTALSRPQVRLSVVAHGLAHALRPESRDRIAALVRREYRGRRRARLRAGRQAARAAGPSVPAERWLGET